MIINKEKLQIVPFLVSSNFMLMGDVLLLRDNKINNIKSYNLMERASMFKTVHALSICSFLDLTIVYR